ncbi:SEC14-like protein 2 [Amphiura filiformis]|uniref:SEC14-like protein 2 n=1 Tax=Amphiura filiformis TaxID=82378 RepID=UPI003B2149A0
MTMSGRIGCLTAQQKDTLDKFKVNLKDVLQAKHDDSMLLRFLRARKFDLKKSEDMFRKHLKWRERNKVDTIMQDHKQPEVLEKYYGGGFVGVDKEGCPVRIEPFGGRDIKGLLHSVKGSDLMRNNIWILETFVKRIQDEARKSGRPIEQFTSISDMEGLDTDYMWRPGLEFNKQITLMCEQNYPEILKRVIMINVKPIFYTLYNLTKHFVNEETRSKFIVLGSNWREDILQYVDADQLPVHYGGTMTDSDGNHKCLSLVTPVGKIPNSYYLKGRQVISKNMESREIKRGSALELQYVISRPGSLIRYEFKTENYDLSFSIKAICEKGKRVDVLKKQRHNCHMVPEDGQITLEQPGTYVIRFDNSDSFLRGKKLSYWVEVLEPLRDDEMREYRVDGAYDGTEFD